MSDPREMTVSCNSPQQIIGLMNSFMPRLPVDTRRMLNNIKLVYLQRYGVVGVFERVNNKTVAEIIEEYDHRLDLKMLEKGENNGVQFEVLKDPNEPDRGAPTVGD